MMIAVVEVAATTTGVEEEVVVMTTGTVGTTGGAVAHRPGTERTVVVMGTIAVTGGELLQLTGVPRVFFLLSLASCNLECHFAVAMYFTLLVLSLFYRPSLPSFFSPTRSLPLQN